MAELTPSQWFDKLNARFYAVTSPAWQDGRVRPAGQRSDARDCSSVSRQYTPRNQLYDTLWSYFIGDPPLPQVASEYQDTFRDVMRKARANYAPMCVTAVSDRMELQAVSTQQDQDTNGDDIAADISEESGIWFKELLDYLFAMSESYAMVVPGSSDALLSTGAPTPTIHAIDPRRCIGLPDRRNPTRLRAALVREFDYESDQHISYLFLPGQKWELRLGAGTTMWTLVDQTPEPISGLDALGGIPIVRFDNAHFLGEYEPHIDLLDRINDTTLQRIVIGWYEAFRKRALIGDEEENDDDDPDVEPIDWSKAGETIFKADPGALWKVPEGFKFWESSPTDLTPIINAKRDDVKEFAAVTSTPLHLVTPDDANGSAEGAGLKRESATAKVRDRRARVTPPLKLLWRIAFALAGETDRGRRMRLHWGPIEFRTLAEQASASSQAQGTLSLEDRCERIWQMSPEEIARNRQRLDAERLLEQATAPTVLPTAGSGNGARPPRAQQPNPAQQRSGEPATT